MYRSKNKDIVSAIIIDDDDDEIKEIYEDKQQECQEKKKAFKIITKRKIKIKSNIEPSVEPNVEPSVETNVETNVEPSVDLKQNIKKKTRNVSGPLKIAFNENTHIIEVGIDEAGRGPMFGRVYAGVVVLPKNNSFDHSQMKDSKKFHSKKKIEQVAEYIKENAIAWAVEYEDEQTIDEINILQATQSAMHKGIKSVLYQLTQQSPEININNILLLVDGNYFKPFTILNKNKTKIETIRYQLVEGGDNKFSSIAAASILAKVERDKYIDELCLENPELVEHYGINTNKGYGSKKHMDGIKQYGITKWHRKTFGICKEFC
jgi:ribonuclease HII